MTCHVKCSENLQFNCRYDHSTHKVDNENSDLQHCNSMFLEIGAIVSVKENYELQLGG